MPDDPGHEPMFSKNKLPEPPKYIPLSSDFGTDAWNYPGYEGEMSQARFSSYNGKLEVDFGYVAVLLPGKDLAAVAQALLQWDAKLKAEEAADG